MSMHPAQLSTSYWHPTGNRHLTGYWNRCSDLTFRQLPVFRHVAEWTLGHLHVHINMAHLRKWLFMASNRVACLFLIACTYMPFFVYAQAPIIDLSEAKKSGQGSQSGRLQNRIAQDNKVLIDLVSRIDSLQQEVQSMLGELELQTHAIDGIKQRQRDLYLDIDRRLQQLESRIGSGSINPSATRSTPQKKKSYQAGSTNGEGSGTRKRSGNTNVILATKPEVTLEQQTAREQARSEYRKAFGLLRQGKYNQAINKFKLFLSSNTESEYADNAQYWVGEANYVQRRFEVALEEFNKVRMNYPKRPKYADSMLKIGMSYYELGEWNKAKLAFKELIERFPDTAQAKLADKRLHQLKIERH